MYESEVVRGAGRCQLETQAERCGRPSAPVRRQPLGHAWKIGCISSGVQCGRGSLGAGQLIYEDSASPR